MLILATVGQLFVHAQPPAGPIGPDGGGAVLKVPGSDFSTAPRPPLPYPGGFPQSPQSPGPSATGQGTSVLNAWNPQVTGPGVAPPQDQVGSSILEKLKPHTGPDVNEKILVGAAQGPWLISITSYTGPESAKMAWDMVQELRGTYRLPAYAYNYGAEERRKEYDRVKDMIEKQKEFFRKSNLPVDQPVRIRYIRIEEQCGVLVGGYHDETTARRALDELRKLKPPDPKKVALHVTSFEKNDAANPGRSAPEHVYVNPFREAFIVRNPAMKVERPETWDRPDVAGLKKLNDGMPLSLLQCKKPMTLAIKQFQTLTVVQERAATGSILDSVGLGKRKTAPQNDQAAANAYIVAAILRENNLPAFVLHTKVSSIVTVGEFDSETDPNLRAMQNHLTANTLQNIVGPRLGVEDLRFFPTPMPMPVPQVSGR